MKKFTKVSLIIVGVMLAVGIMFCGISSVMGAGYGTLYRMARNGDFNWRSWDVDDTTGETYLGSGDETAVNSFAAADVKKLKIDVDAAEVRVNPSSDAENITVDLENAVSKYYECGMDGSTLNVKYDTKNHFPSNHISNHQYHGPILTITVPEGIELESMDLDIGAADMIFTTSKMNCEKVTIDVGAGTLETNGFNVDGKMVVTIGAGTVEINGGTYESVKLECGMGTFDMSGTVNGDVTASCGMGDMEINLNGSETDYNYDLSCGMGDLEVNENSYSSISGSHKVNHDGAIGTISLDCGMGSIELNVE